MNEKSRGKRFVSANTIAAMLEVHPESVRQAKGRFASLTRYKLGRRVRYDLAEVEALIEVERDEGHARAQARAVKQRRLIDRRRRGRLQIAKIRPA